MTKNYFDLLEIQPSYLIDKDKLDENLFAKQIEFHPDKQRNLTDKQREIALEKSQELNSAYQILKSDFKRAQYLLKINNNDPDNESLDMEFLEESFAWREKLLDRENLATLTATIEDEIKKTMQKLGDSLQKELYTEGKKSYIRLKFLKRFLEEIEKTAV